MPLTERVSWGDRQYLVTASLISPHCGRLRVPGKVERGFGEGDMCAYVGPQRRCLHLFISGQMLMVVEIEMESLREKGEGRAGEVDFLHLLSHHSYW